VRSRSSICILLTLMSLYSLYITNAGRARYKQSSKYGYFAYVGEYGKSDRRCTYRNVRLTDLCRCHDDRRQAWSRSAVLGLRHTCHGDHTGRPADEDRCGNSHNRPWWCVTSCSVVGRWDTCTDTRIDCYQTPTKHEHEYMDLSYHPWAFNQCRIMS